MQTRIKRVVYPRSEGDYNAGWIFQQAPAYDSSTFAAIQQPSFIQPARPKLDVRRDLTEHTGWISEFATKPQYAVPSVTFNNPGFVTPQRKLLQLVYHAPWIDDGAYRFQQVPVATYTADLYPAIAFLTQSFRSPKRLQYRPVRSGAPRAGFNAALTPAFAQLVNSYLTAARHTYRAYFHDWHDDQAAIFANAPIPIFDPSIQAFAGAYNYRMPDENVRGHHLLWNSVERSSGAAQEEEREWIPSFQQLLESFLTLARKRLDVTRRGTHIDDAWVGFINRSATIPESRPALDTLLGGFLMGKRKGLHQSQLDWNDTGWIFANSQFDAAFFPSIAALLNSFRQAEGRKLNVRYLDTPHDQWISYNPTIELATWTGAFYSITNSYLMRKRKQTLDILRVEDFHDFAWLRAVLDLTDAPFGIPVAHWRHIEGAIRSRRRRRRGR